MKIKEFIQYKLNELKSDSKESDVILSREDLSELIYKTILSKKFRKFSVIPEYANYIKESIDNSIKEDLPIRFSFPFGGYKLWRLEEAPEVDWAELFTLMYYAKWLKPITAVYKPGIEFDFASDDVIVERLNNVPQSDTKRYAESFNNTINFLKKYIPENLKFTFTSIGSFYTPEEFEKDLVDKIIKKQAEFGGLPALDDKRRRMTELNVRLKSGQDDDPLWREKNELLHQAYYSVDRRRPYTRAKDKILVFPYTMLDGKCIAVGTTKTSVAKFWVGIGALKKIKDSFIEYVLSPSQLEKTEFTKEPISIEGLKGKNFKELKTFV